MFAVTVVVAFLVINCDAISESEFAKNVGQCGYSANEYFETRSVVPIDEFPWNAQLFFQLGKLL